MGGWDVDEPHCVACQPCARTCVANGCNAGVVVFLGGPVCVGALCVPVADRR